MMQLRSYTNRDPTYQDYLDVEALVWQEIEDSTCSRGSWDWVDSLNDCRLFPLIRNPKPLGSRLLRLAFHDAAGFMDGFVDMSLFDNNELDSATIVLDRMYENRQLRSSGDALKAVLSKADFYAWAYIAAVTFGAKQQGVNALQDTDVIPEIPITFGRKTYTGDPADAPAEAFPDGGHATRSHVMQYFHDEFNYTPQEVVALMGAHTLGGARLSASGFAGMWTQSKNKLNLEYYTNLMDPVPLTDCVQGQCEPVTCGAPEFRCQGWEQVPMGGGNFQWRHSCDKDGAGCTHMMLNTDMSLFREIDEYVDHSTGKVVAFPADSPCGSLTESSRILATCFEKVDGDGGLVALYGGDLNLWIHDFGLVFDRMIRRVPPGTTLKTLEALPTCGSGTIADGQPCPTQCAEQLTGDGKVECLACQSCWCGSRNGRSRCRPARWEP